MRRKCTLLLSKVSDSSSQHAGESKRGAVAQRQAVSGSAVDGSMVGCRLHIFQPVVYSTVCNPRVDSRSINQSRKKERRGRIGSVISTAPCVEAALGVWDVCNAVESRVVKFRPDTN